MIQDALGSSIQSNSQTSSYYTDKSYLAELLKEQMTDSFPEETIDVEYIDSEDKFLLVIKLGEITYDLFKENINKPEMTDIWNTSRDNYLELCKAATRYLLRGF